MSYFKEVNIGEYNAQVGFGLPCPLIAIDDGFDQTNTAHWAMENGVLTILEDKIKSRGKRGRHAISMSMEGVGLYSSGDDVYTIRDTMDHEDTRSDDFPKKPLNRFLVHAALSKIGITGGQDVAVVTGLPLTTYMPVLGEVNQRLIDAKRENIMTPVTVGVGNTPSANIVFHGVFPEAIAGLADYLIGNDGKFREGMSFDVVRMVLDIGGRTTDMAIILPGNDIAKIHTINFGVSNMRDTLRRMIESKLDMALDSISLDEALMTKQATLFGKLEDFTKEWNTAISSVLKEIFNAAGDIRKLYPSLREMVCFGGGAALCESMIREQYPEVKMVENPDGANARGYLKFASLDNIDPIRDAILKRTSGTQEPVTVG
ncbi:ParM/StbA family protein [Cellvibrio sp. QJXJ]|uniref:ParM/StbA family protein n=1 Tax=Cellvibrio sp. QJXJ TaxID=2964606 RepID=UPI0021C43737|nr:ParM/StbA family protein [Cellvibrio sp. QJXJ]UUA75136.1 ParM/StbA family protein [Cellvibrio sp. QJXJ]